MKLLLNIIMTIQILLKMIQSFKNHCHLSSCYKIFSSWFTDYFAVITYYYLFIILYLSMSKSVLHACYTMYILLLAEKQGSGHNVIFFKRIDTCSHSLDQRTIFYDFEQFCHIIKFILLLIRMTPNKGSTYS